MSQTESKIKLIFEGAERGVAAAAAKASAAVRSLGDTSVKTSKDVDRNAASLERLGRAAASLGTAGTYAGLFGAAIGAGAAATGAALPALGSLALTFGIAKAAIGGSTEALDAYDKALKDGKGDFTEYNRLLKSMTPEQRAFTEAVVATKKPLSDLQKTAGRSFLPGVTQFLTDSQTLFPILDGAVGRTGKIMGDTAAKLGGLFRTDKFKRDLDQFLKSTEPVTAAIGDSFVRLTDRVIQFGAEMAPAGEGFATFISDLESGVEGFLDGLAPHAADFKSIWESLGSIMRDVLPILGQLAGGLSGQLAPILRDVAGWIRDNKGAISEWVPFIGQAVVGLAGLKLALASLKVVNVITDLAGLAKALGGVGPAAEAGGKAAGSAWKLGFTGALGAGAAGVGGAILADQLIPKDVGKYGSQAARDMLHEMAQVFQGEGSRPFQAWDVAQWIANPISLGVEVGRRELQKLFGMATSNIPPITFNADTGPAQGQVAAFMNQVKGTSGDVQINGRTEDAAQALADIVQAINAGQGTVTVNGQSVPAQQALNDVIGQINRGTGTVTVNGQTVPAGQALAALLGRVNGSSASIGVGANTGAANSAIAGLVNNWNGRHINLIVTTTGSGGIASAGRLAAGGPVVGPGTGTSDTAGLFALSNGEYVATKRNVDNAGGPAAFGRLMDALDRGPAHMASGGSVMRASAKAAMRTPAPAAGSSSGGAVQVSFVGNTSDALATVIMQLQRTGKIQLKAA